MPALHAAVYLNEARDRRWVGFTTPEPTDLHLAGRFELEINDELRGEARLEAAREIIFKQLSLNIPTATWALKYRLTGYRSLSIGDVIVIDDTAWLCQAAGPKPFNTAQLCGSGKSEPPRLPVLIAPHV